MYPTSGWGFTRELVYGDNGLAPYLAHPVPPQSGGGLRAVADKTEQPVCSHDGPDFHKRKRQECLRPRLDGNAVEATESPQSETRSSEKDGVISSFDGLPGLDF
nr:unnamed protein product [Spirometra erinaceieuropaei]